MRIEAVVPSVGYGDFLWDTLPRNMPLVDDLIVVTGREDTESQSAAVKHGARLLTTDAHLRSGRRFDKGALLNHAFKYLTRRDWLLVLDADIVMPHMARRLVEKAEPQEHSIYGVDRLDVPGWVQYASWLTDTAADPGSAVFSGIPRGWRLGGRISAAFGDGWSPCGFWQLWHASVWSLYPELPDTNAEAIDLEHALRWPRPRRVLLPDWFALHLVPATVPLGTNWGGRKSPRWGPPTFAPGQQSAVSGSARPSPVSAAGQDLDGAARTSTPRTSTEG